MYILALPNKIHPYILLGVEGLSKNFSFWTVSLSLFAMLKIKLLMSKDLIFNSRGCWKSNQLLRHPHRFWAKPRTSVSVLTASFSLTPKTSLLWQDVSGFKQYRVAAIYNLHAVNCLARWYVLTAGKCGTLIRRDKGAGIAGVWKAYCIGDTDKRVGADDNKGM